ncbi:SAM-dependent methyltransferase, partial [Anaerovibrio slackiae]
MGKIVVVGIGPGSFEDMTPRARQAIESAQVVAGYKTY